MERKNTTITIFGGSGFIGSYVVQELAKTGAYIKVASRYPERSSFLKTAGNIGQIYLYAWEQIKNKKWRGKQK